MGKDIVRLLDHLKIQRAHIVGFSIGAIIVGHLLTTDADRFLSATLVAHPAARTWTAKDEQEAEAYARDLESDTPCRLLILGIQPPGTPLPRDDEIRTLSQRFGAANEVRALAAFNRGRRGLVAPDAQLAAVRVPTLGIIGSADPAVAGMRDLKTVMPALTVIVVDGATHGGEHGLLQRAEFLASLRDFFAASR